MKKSTHRVEIVALDPTEHPNADSLSIQQVFGYRVVLRTEDWQGVKYGAYLVPDSVVDTHRPEFDWLSPSVNKNFRAATDDTRYHRVTTMRLRGIVSYGLMVPAPEGMVPGDDASDFLGVTRYQPTIVSENATHPPDRLVKDYDLEAFERYADEIFKPGEMVCAVEKLDGINSRFCYQDRIHAGTKSIWIDPVKGDQSSVWKVLQKYPELEQLCRDNQNLTVYGEIVGYPHEHKTKLRYGVEEGDVDFYVFDMLSKDRFVNDAEIKDLTLRYRLKQAPVVAQIPYNFQSLQEIAAGQSLVKGANHKREGIVVRSYEERQELAGRAVLKLVAW